eukprot:TRINITY_DN8745_c0_g1_i1.p1 TRINITY_DN8745_c0_g1~~TRINITY_DN8745_c0_g1_i1.p1  ORF type:complete len:327 (+),score=111.51 TRINITY_DN8745_c0_g1_i1:131-1111(+)
MGCCFSVSQAEVAFVERWGEFNRICEAGLNFKWPISEQVVGSLDTRIQQTWINVDTKSRDNVFVRVSAAAQYRIVDDMRFEAMYRLSNPTEAIRAATVNALRSFVPTLAIDELFLEKDRMAQAVRDALTESMMRNGYQIINVLVVDIAPNNDVKHAMNNINTQERLRIAAMAQADAKKVTEIMAAEADAERKRLQGVGFAMKRQELILGLRGSLVDFTESVPGVDTHEVLNLLLLGQHFDAMIKAGERAEEAGGAEILIPLDPASVKHIKSQLRSGLCERRPGAAARLVRDEADEAGGGSMVGVFSSPYDSDAGEIQRLITDDHAE